MGAARPAVVIPVLDTGIYTVVRLAGISTELHQHCLRHDCMDCRVKLGNDDEGGFGWAIRYGLMSALSSESTIFSIWHHGLTVPPTGNPFSPNVLRSGLEG